MTVASYRSVSAAVVSIVQIDSRPQSFRTTAVSAHALWKCCQ